MSEVADTTISLVDSRSMNWVTHGRDFWTASMFTHLLFLSTYFPSTWKQDYMKAFHFAHPRRFFDTEEDVSRNTEQQRIRACFHAFKYMLGLYDWDRETGKQVEEFPSCYKLPHVSSETFEEVMVEFKNCVFTKMWYVFSTHDESGKLVVLNMDLVERTKEAFNGKRLAILTKADEDIKDPYKNGLGFAFLNEMKIPLDAGYSEGEYMRFIDVAGLFVSFDYGPLSGPNLDAAILSQYIPPSDIDLPETIARFSKSTFKNAIHNTFSGHHTAVWNLNKNKCGGSVRPEAVARRKTTMTNGIYLYCKVLHELKNNRDALREEVQNKLEELGLLAESLLTRNFGMLQVAEPTRKGVKNSKTPFSAFKSASQPRGGSPSSELKSGPVSKRKTIKPLVEKDRVKKPRVTSSPVILRPEPGFHLRQLQIQHGLIPNVPGGARYEIGMVRAPSTPKLRPLEIVKEEEIKQGSDQVTEHEMMELADQLDEVCEDVPEFPILASQIDVIKEEHISHPEVVVTLPGEFNLDPFSHLVDAAEFDAMLESGKADIDFEAFMFV